MFFWKNDEKIVRIHTWQFFKWILTLWKSGKMFNVEQTITAPVLRNLDDRTHSCEIKCSLDFNSQIKCSLNFETQVIRSILNGPSQNVENKLTIRPFLLHLLIVVCTKRSLCHLKRSNTSSFAHQICRNFTNNHWGLLWLET